MTAKNIFTSFKFDKPLKKLECIDFNWLWLKSISFKLKQEFNRFEYNSRLLDPSKLSDRSSVNKFVKL